MKKELCAVVVTYNRRQLLKRCLQSILDQTRPPDQILVVNNASTDGTTEMLAFEFPQVQILELAENVGGAGGFYEGIKWAYLQGFDWIVVMDDDGYPATHCVEQLLECSDPSLLVRGPLVLDNGNHASLAFRLYPKNCTIKTREEAEEFAEEGLIRDYINPFNGLLMNKAVVEKIGLPEKEMFLWGDEYEYFLRMRQRGIDLATVVNAHFYHPRDQMQARHVRLLVREFPVYYVGNPLKDYLILRNQAYIVRKYRGWPGWIVHVMRYLVFYWKMSGLKDFSTVFKGSLHGARADFSHHKKYLP